MKKKERERKTVDLREEKKERGRNVSVVWQRVLSKTKRPSSAARLSRQKKGDARVASRKILVDFWRTIEVVNAHRRRAVSIIDITALCYISFYVSAFCHAARLSVSNVRFYVSRLRFQRKHSSGSNYRRSRYSASPRPLLARHRQMFHPVV